MPILVSLVLGLLMLEAPPAQRFTSSSELVVLHVTVLDRKSGFISGLSRDAFTVYEEGSPQPVSFFESADTPVTVGLVIDSSISMQRRREAIVAAGTSFISSSRPDDELFTVHFNERVWPGLPAGQTFTSDRETLRQALAQIVTRGQTALFDGLAAALATLGEGRCQKKVLIVVSDGGDNASRSKFEEILATALRMDAVIYAVSLQDQYDPDARPDVLRKLASVTGGEAFFVRNLSQASGVFDRIARDIRSGYIIGYVPGGAGGYRPIRVAVRSADGRKLMVRARSGYQR